MRTKDEINAYQRKWYGEHREQLREYRREHKEQRQKTQRKYYEAHREQEQEYQREYASKHRESERERARKWYKVHKEQELESRWAERQKVLELLGGECIKCGITDIRLLQINHKNGGGFAERRKFGYWKVIRDILKGGRDTSDIDLRCANCNILYEYECGRRYNRPDFEIREKGIGGALGIL